MTVRMLVGDVREVLRTLPDQSVHCVITSPPYFGLRDYGTAQWDGDDPTCDHLGPPKTTQNGFNQRYHGTPGSGKQSEVRDPFGATCGKCGAARIDKQIGLEATVADYLATLVDVFREVPPRVRRYPHRIAQFSSGEHYITRGGYATANPLRRGFRWPRRKTPAGTVTP